MSKFAVGDKVRYIGPVEGGITLAMLQAGMTGVVESIGPNHDTPADVVVQATILYAGHQLYEVHWDGLGTYGFLPEKYLSPIPPDDHASTQDTSEDPGLSRLKKLLEQDRQKHKQPQKA